MAEMWRLTWGGFGGSVFGGGEGGEGMGGVGHERHEADGE